MRRNAETRHRRWGCRPGLGAARHHGGGAATAASGTSAAGPPILHRVAKILDLDRLGRIQPSPAREPLVNLLQLRIDLVRADDPVAVLIQLPNQILDNRGGTAPGGPPRGWAMRAEPTNSSVTKAKSACVSFINDPLLRQGIPAILHNDRAQLQ